MSSKYNRPNLLIGALQYSMRTDLIVAITAIAAAAAVATLDGRANRRSPIQRFSIRTDTWARVQADPLQEGWFHRNLRCCRRVFDAISQRIEERWDLLHAPLHHTLFSLSEIAWHCLSTI